MLNTMTPQQISNFACFYEHLILSGSMAITVLKVEFYLGGIKLILGTGIQFFLFFDNHLRMWILVNWTKQC